MGGGGGTAIWDNSLWAAEGGDFYRLDHIGRGRLMRIIFQNSRVDEAFKVNAFGVLAHLETHAG